MRAYLNLITVTAVTAGVLAAPGAASADDAVLPAEISAARPAHLVSTSLDATGRPVIRTRTATSRAEARRFVAEGRAADNPVAVEVDAPVRITDVPAGTDPYRADQWDFAKLDIASAWPYSTGAGVTVAVIDTGVDAGHPDLAGNVLPGIDYVTGTTGTSTDENGHGTHVAGTIAALTGNDIGVSSIAPSARILPVRALDATGKGDMSDAASGIVWATDHGADVINMSLGSAEQLEVMEQAVAYARSHGVTVVAAAGNDGAKGSPASYPAAGAGVIAVAAVDSGDQLASFSTRGSYVDVAAPGVGILSTRPVALGSYGTANGTSMAAPHVAAVAALIKAYRPEATPDQIERALEDTAVDLGPAGQDDGFGYGRIAPVAALTGVTPVVAVSTGSRDVVVGTALTTRWTVTADGSPMAGAPVRACTSTAGAAYTCEDLTTTTAGTITVTATATALRRIRLTVPATATTAAVTTAVTTYTVRPKVTVARTAAGRITITMAGVGGQTIQVQRLTAGRWSNARSYPATARRGVTGLVAGARYRVVVPATAALAAATSATVTA